MFVLWGGGGGEGMQLRKLTLYFKAMGNLDIAALKSIILSQLSPAMLGV